MSEQANLKSGPAEEAVPDCPHCGKPLPLCICDSVTPIKSKVSLLILQHPQEQDRALGTARLTALHFKNAVLKIGLSSADAIFEACSARFRPILMTTMAALFAGIPLVIATGPGTELRRPLGITIIGGLFVSQILTLYTTPVIYLLIDRLRRRWRPAPLAAPAE